MTGTTHRILVVDDDQDHADSLAEILELNGHHVTLAFSGEDGAAAFRSAPFDIVFMDVKLPGMSGVETFFEFRRIRPGAKVMMMTGFSLEQLIAEALAGGALGVLHKPFSVTDVLSTLDRVKPRGLVLVADDDPLFAESLEPVLLDHGYRVLIARDGGEAVRRVLEGGVDCLVLDLRLPVMTGLEVYLTLHASGRAVPTILVSGDDDAATRLAEADGGRPDLTSGGLAPGGLARVGLDRVGDLLAKPFHPADLIRAIAAATGGVSTAVGVTAAPA